MEFCWVRVPPVKEAPMTDLVLLERQGEIAKVTLNQPSKLNAVNNEMWSRLREIFVELDDDDGLRCVILAGAGERAFSVGADISEFEQNRSTIDQARRYHQRTHAAMQAIFACRHPVIAQIRGLCVGGGLELATTCDLRICGAGARFGIPVKRLGLVVSYTELKPLLDLIGPANALEILLEGQIHGAEDALRMGLVNRIVPDDEVEHEVFATAMRLAEGAPLVARWHKKFTRRLMQAEPLSDEEMDESFHCFETEDFLAGYRAFLAKADPEFKGR
jgi:enoyl-CoA hydratase/carnithine racemase